MEAQDLETALDMIRAAVYDLRFNPPKLIDGSIRTSPPGPLPTYQLDPPPLFLVETLVRLRAYLADPAKAVHTCSGPRDQYWETTPEGFNMNIGCVFARNLPTPWKDFDWTVCWRQAEAQILRFEDTPYQESIRKMMDIARDRKVIEFVEEGLTYTHYDQFLLANGRTKIRMDDCDWAIRHDPGNTDVGTEVRLVPAPDQPPDHVPFDCWVNFSGKHHLRGVLLLPAAYETEHALRRPVWQRLVLEPSTKGGATIARIDGLVLPIRGETVEQILRVLIANRGQAMVADAIRKQAGLDESNRVDKLLRRLPSPLQDYIFFPGSSGSGYRLKERAEPDFRASETNETTELRQPKPPRKSRSSTKAKSPKKSGS